MLGPFREVPPSLSIGGSLFCICAPYAGETSQVGEVCYFVLCSCLVLYQEVMYLYKKVLQLLLLQIKTILH